MVGHVFYIDYRDSEHYDIRVSKRGGGADWVMPMTDLRLCV